MIQLLLLHEEGSVFQFPLLFPLAPLRTLCAAGSDAPSSLPYRPKSSPGPGSGTCSSSSSPHTWTQRRRQRLFRPAAPRGWRGGGREGIDGRKESGWESGGGGVEGNGRIRKGRAGPAAVRARYAEIYAPREAVPGGPRPSDRRFSWPRGSLPGHPTSLVSPAGGGRRPRVEGRGGSGVSEARRGQGCPGYCGD